MDVWFPVICVGVVIVLIIICCVVLHFYTKKQMSGKDDKQFKKELKNQTYIYNFRVKFDEDKV